MRTLSHGFLLALKPLGYVGFSACFLWFHLSAPDCWTLRMARQRERERGFSDYGLGLRHFGDSEGFWSEFRAFLSACSANLVETIGYPSRPRKYACTM